MTETTKPKQSDEVKAWIEKSMHPQPVPQPPKTRDPWLPGPKELPAQFDDDELPPHPNERNS